MDVIANPQAAGGKGRRALGRLRQQLRDRGIEHRLHMTSGAGDAARWASALPASPGAEPILVVGGDGTLHEVANGLLEREGGAGDRPLIVLPVGTGNDFHRMLRSGSGLEETLDLVEKGVIRPFDVGRARFEGGQRYFVNLLGVGIDVAVLQRRNRFRLLPGILQYFGALLSALLRFRPLPTRLAYRDAQGTTHELEGRTLLSALTVGPSVGGGFRLAPAARPDDGLLDLFQVERLSLVEIARILPRVLRGTQEEGPRLHLRTLRSARITRSDGAPMAFELDGEVMTSETPWLDVDVVPGALRFLDRPEARDSQGPTTEVRPPSRVASNDFEAGDAP